MIDVSKSSLIDF